jgi:uncharacterized protein
MPPKRLARRKFLKQLAQTAAVVVPSSVSNALAQVASSPDRASLDSASALDKGVTPWFLQGNHRWVRTMSEPKYDIQFEFNVKKIPMRDGVKLAANVWRPKAKGRFPAVYIHISYDKSNASFAVARAKYFVPRGYVFIAVDCRGRYDSDGDPYFYWHTDWRDGGFEGQDVQDTLNWIGQQEWSSGKIGMTGPSYLGFVQWMGASLGSPYLSALIPYVTPDDHYDNVYPGGAFQLTNSMHCMAVIGSGSRTNNNDLEPHFYDWNGLVRHLPLRTLDTAMLGRKAEVWQDFIDHPDNDHYWRFSVGDRPRTGEMGAGRYSQVNVPSLNITGWYDQVSQATINNYMGMVRYGPKNLRDKHQLIVGPWEHAVGLRKVGDLDFGPASNGEYLPPDLAWSAYWLRNVELRWYDYWLKGIDNGVMDEAPVHVFAMGENKWLSEGQWPSSNTSQVKFYIHSAGHANSRYGDGTLSKQAPGQELNDSFVYDPEDPVPTFGGIQLWQGFGIPNSDGPRDQRSIQNRNDVLVYTSEALGEKLHVNGRVMFNLFASTTASDTDFTAKLVDLHPDGYAQILRDGILRGRYRGSYKKQELLTPGSIYEFNIDLWSISHVFLKGHRIQVEISSSNFPKYDRNPNTGSKFGEDAQLQKATQTIYHSLKHSSHLVLPIL